MADGELTVKLDDETNRRLKAAADAAGVPVEAYVRSLIATDVAEDRWAESLRRLEEMDRTGEYMAVEETMAHFDAELRRVRAARK